MKDHVMASNILRLDVLQVLPDVGEVGIVSDGTQLICLSQRYLVEPRYTVALLKQARDKPRGAESGRTGDKDP